MMETIQKLRSKGEVPALTIFRVTVGVIMVAHGWMKITNVEQWVGNLGQMGIPAPEVAVWLAIAGELGGGLGLIVGLLTPLAALGVFFAMATAILSVHIDNGLFAKDGGFEYPLTILVAALFFVMRGGGPVSLDALVARSRGRTHGREGRAHGSGPGVGEEAPSGF